VARTSANLCHRRTPPAVSNRVPLRTTASTDHIAAMSFSLVYTKTPKGLEEVRLRSDAISPLARRVLIMVDGKRTEDELRWVVRNGELDEILVTLRAQGLIEECGLAELPDADWAADATVAEEGMPRIDLGLPGRAAATPPPPPTLRIELPPAAVQGAAPIAPALRSAPAARPHPAPPAPQEIPLEEVKRAAVRALYDRLGPYGEAPAARIQECKSHDELRAQIRNACKRIVTFRGEPAAREYLAAIGLQ
jgi:hypothetical protein